MAGFTKTKEIVKKMEDGSAKEMAKALVGNIDFLSSEMLKLKKDLKKDGWVEVYQNGENQKGIKKSSKGETYLQMSKELVNNVKALSAIMQDGSGTGQSELAAFMRGIKK